MKRNMVLVTLVLLLGIAFVAGCAKKTVLQEERGVAKEQAAVKQGAGEAKPAEKAAVAETPEKRALREEQAKREAAVKEAEKVAAEERAAAAKAALKEVQEKAALKEVQETAVRVEAAAAPSREFYEFRDVNFDFDKFNLREDAREILKKHAEWLNKNKDVMIAVEGHCDERGTTEYNLALGERRASAGAKFLVDMGIDARRIKTISYGEELPLDPGHNEEAWAKNRRAHFVVSGKK